MSEESYEVVITVSAARDLNEIIHYIAQESQDAADRILKRLNEKARSLEFAPDRGRIVPELASIGIRSWRELIVRPWRIIYRSRERKVEVWAILDGRRDLEDILLERLTLYGEAGQG